MSNTFETEVNDAKNEMLELLNSINVDGLSNEGIVISFGGKNFKFKDVEIAEDRTEAIIRNEYREKINTQQELIRQKINAKISQLHALHKSKQAELDRKEKQLEDKYKNSAKMPDISYNHLRSGLSVVKGDANDELMWCYRGVYNPKFIDHKKLPDRIVNKIKSDIVIIVKTKGNQITNVSTRTLDTLDYFIHYHQATPDCWGRWDSKGTWKNADDILRKAKDAEAVLENINSGSVAKRHPNGLPKMETLQKHVVGVRAYSGGNLRDSNNNNNNNNDDMLENVWTT